LKGLILVTIKFERVETITTIKYWRIKTLNAVAILFKEYLRKEIYARLQNEIVCFAIVLQQIGSHSTDVLFYI